MQTKPGVSFHKIDMNYEWQTPQDINEIRSDSAVVVDERAAERHSIHLYRNRIILYLLNLFLIRQVTRTTHSMAYSIHLLFCCSCFDLNFISDARHVSIQFWFSGIYEQQPCRWENTHWMELCASYVADSPILFWFVFKELFTVE